MPPVINLTGHRYNNLTVLKRTKNIKSYVAWLCRCDCGNETIVRTGHLRSSQVKSCGKCNFIKYKFEKDYVIGISNDDREFYIDFEDYLRLKNYTMHVTKKGYCSFVKDGKKIILHRYLMNPKDSELIDHINRKPYDNRKSNLRICTKGENTMNKSIRSDNKSGVAGVNYRERKKRWEARITVNGKEKYLGQFINKEEAIKARKEAEKKYFGEFAPK